MHDAVDWKIIDENPFCKLKTQKSSVKVNEFVPREVVDKLMKKANPVWQVILGLSRYGGLRTPSETLSLRWDDNDPREARTARFDSIRKDPNRSQVHVDGGVPRRLHRAPWSQPQTGHGCGMETGGCEP
jgi:integrase